MSALFVDAAVQDCITDEQAQFFLDNGYLVVKNVIRGEELRLIQESMLHLVEYGAKEIPHEDFMYGKGAKSGKQILKRIEYVIDKNDHLKGLLGHPFVLSSVEKLQGVNFIPTWDSMVMKMPDEGIIVPWHRDAQMPDGYTGNKPIFNVDFYLDASDIKSCLWVIPGSNKWSKEEAYKRCAQDKGFDTSDAIAVPLAAGDMIFHDITVLHGSPSGDGNSLRRTVYYEFRPAEIEAEFGPHSQEYIPLKQQLLLDCVERRTKAGHQQGEKTFDYKPEGQFAVGSIQKPRTYRYKHSDYWKK
jgi:ectoine hydroxylase-related dioxygenase (phytanoyl-CoA dioxygenase family)